MAKVVITLKIMPAAPDTDLAKIEEDASKLIKEFGGDVAKVEKEPVAFGLIAVKLMFIMDEDIGSTEDLETSISESDVYASNLAKQIDCTYSHVVKILQQMEKANLINFQKSGRLKILTLTKKGTEVAEKIEAIKNLL